MRRLVSSVTFASVFLLSATASADVIDPRSTACGADSKEGDACEVFGKAGVCKKDQCSRNDYSQGTPPKTVSYDCMLCVEGEPDGAAAPDAKEEPEDAKAEDAKGEESKEDPAEQTPAATKEPADAKSDAKETEAHAPKKSGCAVGANPVSMASVGLGLLLIGFAARRRR